MKIMELLSSFKHIGFPHLNDDDKLLIAKSVDMLRICQKNFSHCFSHFLDERQIALIKSFLAGNTNNCDNNDIVPAKINGADDVRFSFFGGYPDASRKIMCAFHVSDNPALHDFPVSCLTFHFNENFPLSHRDFLGAFMSLGINRNTLGDILVSTGVAQAFTSSASSLIITSEIKKIARTGVKISTDQDFFLSDCVKFIPISGTVSSLRLDALISLALHMSRNKALQLINASCVAINYFPAVSPSALLKKGDVFSVRGFGKFAVSDVGGLSKNGRLHVKINKYS